MFIKRRASATWKALKAYFLQMALWLDQGFNCGGLGLAAVVMAAVTGEEQAPCYADETLSAHAHRAGRVSKPWAKKMEPLIDWMFRKQKTDPRIDKIVGRVVDKHCERAFYKKRERFGLPKEYRGPR